MSDDDLLARATRDLRKATTGDSDRTADTLDKILNSVEGRKAGASRPRLVLLGGGARKKVVVRAAALLAASFALTTAWAATTGHLAKWLDIEDGAARIDAPTAPAGTTAGPARPSSDPSTEPAPPADDDAMASLARAPEVDDAPFEDAAIAPSRPAAPTAPGVSGRPQTQSRRGATSPADAAPPSPAAAVATAQPPAAQSDESDAAFERANRLHFDGHYRDALAAWDNYMQIAPNGRFAPEARFNRAIALWKLGRIPEAKEALRPFAEGAYGEYRRSEAERLLDVRDR